MDFTSAPNTTLIPSARDLLLVVPRLAQRAGSLFHLPEGIMDGIWSGGSVIAEPTSQQLEVLKATLTNASALAQSTAATLNDTLSEGWAQGSTEESSSVFGMMLQFIGKIKSFGGIFSYLTSRWALATFAVAIALNRLQFYASPREKLQLRWYVRLAIYAVPIMAFLTQMNAILEAMRCQTSPDFALLRYGDPLKTLSMDFGGEEGFLYNLSSNLLFWKDDAACCAARSMSIPALEGDTLHLHGTMSLLFRFFLTLCMSQLFETLFCALSGRHPVPETGMTIFEHSLAFAECEAMISSPLGFGYFGSTKSDDATPSSSTDAGPLLTRGAILQRLNVPPEVLLVCLITCCSHLSSAFLCIIDKRHKVRLVNTAIWSCCYMAAFVWSIVRVISEPIESVSDLGVLRFPTVCIVGFIPHLLILVGIVLCGIIYGLALLLSAFSIPDEVSAGFSFSQRLRWAYGNLQANVQFSQNSAIRIHMSQDFYTVLLKVGFSILTAASEAVYLNEGSKVNAPKMTWLEQKRIDELATRIERRRPNLIPQELMGEEIAKGVGFVDHQNPAMGYSAYARERRSRPRQGEAQMSLEGERESGLGIVQRRSRMHLTFDFVAGIFWLVTSLQAQLALNALQLIGLNRRPAWLLKAAGIRASNNRNQFDSSLQAPNSNTDTLAFWMINPDGALVPAQDRGAIDVEAEMRRKRAQMGLHDEPALADCIYSWWKQNGWFGDVDGSGDYAPPSRDLDHDDDLTSDISLATSATSTASNDGDDARTPTQRVPFSRCSNSPTPSFADDDTGFDATQLSRLLAPSTSADRAEAALLASSLTSSGPLTRSRYRAIQTRSSGAILHNLPDSEAELEAYILSQRSKKAAEGQKSGQGTWENGGEGMGEGGPQCVVCQSGPRTVLVWPCGCLSMCDDCRVGLAMRNFSKCVCCRADTVAFSRLYVP